ncbi:MAG: carbohydrate-binding family 9-like protein, partial [Deltaproteobacteria bacterium]|nr:carbohydrate-binding family 9-like protein [Deltaproteobacteria bacterium]
MGRITLCALLIAAIAVSFCSKPRKFVLTKDQKKRISENILTEQPKPDFPLNANLEDTIKLIGVDVSPKEAKAGEKVKITYYWESLKEAPGAWKIFVHLELPGRKMENLDHQPVQSLYPINQWKKGEIIKDVQEVKINEEIEQGTATLWIGVFNEDILREQGTGDRMKLVNKAQVQNDGNNRIKAAQFTVSGKADREAKKEELSKLRVVKAMGKITVDGKLDEPAWGEAERSKPFRGANGSDAPADLETTISLLYDDENLFFGFNVKDKNIFNNKQNRDDMLWEQDVVEIYIDHDGDGKDYLEIQIA